MCFAPSYGYFPNTTSNVPVSQANEEAFTFSVDRLG